MPDEKDLVQPGTANQPEKPEEECPCKSHLIPEVITAWNMSRAACERLPDDAKKEKCRAEMEAMAKTIKDVESGSDVIYRFIMADPTIDAVEAAFEAQVMAAKGYNANNTEGLLRVAQELEAKKIELPPKMKTAIAALRLQQGI